METARVVQVDYYEIRFDNGYVLSSDHDQDCCESHYLSFGDLSLEDFDRMDFTYLVIVSSVRWKTSASD